MALPARVMSELCGESKMRVITLNPIKKHRPKEEKAPNNNASLKISETNPATINQPSTEWYTLQSL